MSRVTPTALRLLRSDPFAALVQALENFDETTQIATPAGILTGRVVVPRAPRLAHHPGEITTPVTAPFCGRWMGLAT